MASSARKLFRLCLFLVFYCLALPMPQPAFSLDPAKRVDQYTLEVWDSGQLFGARTVFAILQTRDGYLWLGTSSGLLRFDGFHFVLFEPANTPAFLAAEVRALLETEDGSLWIGVYGGGVVRLRDGSFESFGKEHGLSSPLVRALAPAEDGGVWVGTHGGGVARLTADGAVTEQIGAAQGLLSQEVRCLFKSRGGDLWIGTEKGGAQRRRGGRFETFSAAQGLKGDTVMAFAEDAAGGIYIATTWALHHLAGDGGALRQYSLADGLASDYLFALGQDRQGALWVGTGGGGLSRFAGGRFANLGAADGLPGDYVWSFHEDRSGSLWVGLEGGLVRLADGAFTVWGQRHGLPADQVHGLLEDRQGAIWIAGPKGLSRFAAGRVEVLGKAQGLPIAETRSLLEASDGALWVSTEGAGLARLKDGEIAIFPPSAGGLGDGIVWSLAETPDGAIWAGTQNSGVSRYAAGKWTTFRQRDGLGADNVRALLVDRAGDLWAGTMGGLSRIRDGRITTFTSRDGLGGDSVLSVYQDQDGHLWVGTLSGGLSLFENGRFISFDRRRGFFADAIGAITGDDLGYLWLNAKGGPFRVRRDELYRLFTSGGAARADQLDALSFAQSGSRGILGALGGGFTPAVFKTRDGRLLYASSRGMGIGDPRRLAPPPGPAPTIVEKVLANHREVGFRPPPVLPAGTYDLEIHYTAPSLDAPGRTRFRYQLEGFDRGWVEVADRRTAYYPSLPPGQFVFRVAAADQNGGWGPAAALPVVLEPYFWQTGWFRALLVALGAWALYGLYRLRAGRLEARAAVAEERNRLAREIHDTLAQDLAAILAYARQGLGSAEEPERAAPIFEDIAALATGSLAEARRSLQALRPPALDDKSLAQALEEIARSLAAAKGAEIEVRASLTREPPPAAAAELLRIAKEAIGNALRHGGARHVVLELAEEDGELLLRVRDDGAGFDPAAPAVGYGLLGMRERAAALGGRLFIDSAAGAGAVVEARIPATGGLA
jgi:ligand-binding sensor domain-containing protein/two-component sensor histidine kinase